MYDVILVGEPMAMFMADYPGKLEDVDKFTRSLAGSEVNVCIGLKRLGYNVGYVTKLGDDPFGRYIIKYLKSIGIDTSNITVDKEYPTAFQLKSKVESGDPEVVYYRKGSAASHITTDDIDRINLIGVKHVHVTGILPAISQTARAATYELINRAREEGVYITFDPNLRPSLWASKNEMIDTINDIASRCDVVLPGIEEGRILTGHTEPDKISDFYLALGTKAVIVKTGDKGAFAKTNYESFAVSGFRVDNVVDTVGAGDGFAVGIISGLLEGLSLKDAIIRGNAIGSLQVMVRGDNEGLPDRYKLENYIYEHINEVNM